MLKEVSRIPAEGVETREGATSAMFGLAPRAPDGVARPRRATRSGDEAVRLCAAAGATTLRLPGVAARTRGSPRSPRCPPPPRWRPSWRRRRATTSTSRPGPTPTTRPRGARREHPPRRRRLRQRLLDAVHEPDRAAARPGPRRGHRGLRRRPGQARGAAAERLDLDPDAAATTSRSARIRTSTRCSSSRACPSTAGSRAPRSRPASTCWSRSRSRRRWRRPRRCSRPPRRRPGISSARRTSCSRRPTGRCTRASRAGEIGGLLTARARYGWAGPGLEPLVLRAGRRRAVRPRRLQRHEPVRLLRAGAARDRDDRRRDPRARHRRRARCACRPRTTRTC